MQKYIFFVVPGDGDALLGMPNIEVLNILQINYNTIGTKRGEGCRLQQEQNECHQCGK